MNHFSYIIKYATFYKYAIRLDAWHERFNSLLWNTELHVLFLAYRHGPHGKFFLNFHSIFNRGDEKIYLAADFLKICTPKFVGCVYKIVTQFFFKRPILMQTSLSTINGYCHDDDVSYFIGLANHHFQEAFGVRQVHRETYMNIMRAFYYSFHDFGKFLHTSHNYY